MTMVFAMLLSVLFCAYAMAEPLHAIPLSVKGQWSVEVGPGKVTLGGAAVTVATEQEITVPAPQAVHVRDERHATLPVFNPKAGGWRRGVLLHAVVTQECSATGLLVPESVHVKPATGGGAPFVRGHDYELEPFWGAIGRLEGGAIGAQQPVFIDYDYYPCRLDSIAANAAGQVRLVEGKPGVGVILPPTLAPGEVRIANIWLPGKSDSGVRVEQLTGDNLFPIEQTSVTVPDDSGVAAKLLPKTLKKLQAGETVTIVAWGDSVTHGGGVGADTDHWYQNRFAALLKKRFPKADIHLITAAWPGGNSRGYMSAPPGDKYDFERDVLAPKPDLITVEFVNDAYLTEEGVQQHYAEIMKRLTRDGAEVILITPHFVRPDWMGVKTEKVDADPRPYVKGLRRFAAENHVALADASQLWCQLWRTGIPYTTMLANSINHPDKRGHELFAEALMALFPAR